jgi:L-seryl-tRNA(Ser) seleniumtransferase
MTEYECIGECTASGGGHANQGNDDLRASSNRRPSDPTMDVNFRDRFRTQRPSILRFVERSRVVYDGRVEYSGTEIVAGPGGEGCGNGRGRGANFVDRDVLRRLPPVGAVLEHEVLVDSVRVRGRVAVLRSVRTALEEARAALRRGQSLATDPGSLARRSRVILDGERMALRRVINATGILLHTGLGRAPLAEEAIAAVTATALGYCNLELDLEDGTRGRRAGPIDSLLRRLTGAEAATAVNNNAGATVLALRALASDCEVIVSRGELVEIGGSFRLPEIFELSGATLREVGTTNKTRLIDYERAIGPKTAAIIRVHRSNFQIVGFTESAPLAEMVGLAHSRGLVMIDDIGSGALGPGSPPAIVDEPTVKDGITAGADVVLFSGDKLLGGPQCGIMVGSAEAIGRIESDPLMRALRLDKMVLAALEATLALALDADRAAERIPLWRMLAVPLEKLTRRAEKLATAFRNDLGLNASILPSDSFIGGGSAPDQAIASVAVGVAPPFPSLQESANRWAMALRHGEPPVVARVHKGLVLFDLRTIAEDQEPDLLDAVRQVCHDRIVPTRSNGPSRPVDRVDNVNGIHTIGQEDPSGH